VHEDLKKMQQINQTELISTC